MNNSQSDKSLLGSFSPWWYIWVQPRRTIRQCLDNYYNKNMFLISWIVSIFAALDQAARKNMGDHYSLWIILAIAIISGAIFGILGLYISSWVLKTTGKWLGGTADFDEMKIAITRGYYVPSIIIGMLWIPELLIFKTEMFTSVTPTMEDSQVLSLVYLFLVVLEFVLGVWAFFIGLKAIGEAHQFSAWRALGSTLIPAVILFVVIMIFVVIFTL